MRRCSEKPRDWHVVHLPLGMLGERVALGLQRLSEPPNGQRVNTSCEKSELRPSAACLQASKVECRHDHMISGIDDDLIQLPRCSSPDSATAQRSHPRSPDAACIVEPRKPQRQAARLRSIPVQSLEVCQAIVCRRFRIRQVCLPACHFGNGAQSANARRHVHE